ncbi:MAG: YggT family protein [Chloroflexota bacterium]
MPLVVLNFLELLISALMLLVIARVVVSWLAPSGGGGLVAFIYQATEPILAPIRRVVRPTGGLDWAPLIAMLVLGVLLRLVIRLGN